jgi:hypothetical protein
VDTSNPSNPQIVQDNGASKTDSDNKGIDDLLKPMDPITRKVVKKIIDSNRSQAQTDQTTDLQQNVTDSQSGTTNPNSMTAINTGQNVGSNNAGSTNSLATQGVNGMSAAEYSNNTAQGLAQAQQQVAASQNASSGTPPVNGAPAPTPTPTPTPPPATVP